MSSANPLWGAPRIHGELLKLGIEISQATVAKYMVRRQGTPSQSWLTFLHNHIEGIAAIDMFVVASASFRLLYVMIILAHDRRSIVRTAVTEHPTAAWLSRQLIEAFPWDTAPRYLLRDRDASYGADFRSRVEARGITEVITAPRSPWQNAYVERVIGSIRRECLDHIVNFYERHLRRVLLPPIDADGGPAPEHLSLNRFVAMQMKRRGVEMRLVLEGDSTPSRVNPPLLKAVARARRWSQDLLAGRVQSTVELAKREGIDRRSVRRLIRLGFLSPRIVEAIVEGRQPPDLTVIGLTRRVDLPLLWNAQESALSIQ